MLVRAPIILPILLRILPILSSLYLLKIYVYPCSSVVNYLAYPVLFLPLNKTVSSVLIRVPIILPILSSSFPPKILIPKSYLLPILPSSCLSYNLFSSVLIYAEGLWF